MGIKISEFFTETIYMSSEICDRMMLWGKDLTISGVREIEIKGDKKLAMDFYNMGSVEVPTLILNRTRAKTLQEAFGDDTDNWINKKIQLQKVKVMYKGQMVDSIGIIPIREVV